MVMGMGVDETSGPMDAETGIIVAAVGAGMMLLAIVLCAMKAQSNNTGPSSQIKPIDTSKNQATEIVQN